MWCRQTFIHSALVPVTQPCEYVAVESGGHSFTNNLRTLFPMQLGAYQRSQDGILNREVVCHHIEFLSHNNGQCLIKFSAQTRPDQTTSLL